MRVCHHDTHCRHTRAGASTGACVHIWARQSRPKARFSLQYLSSTATHQSSGCSSLSKPLLVNTQTPAQTPTVEIYLRLAPAASLAFPPLMLREPEQAHADGVDVYMCGYVQMWREWWISDSGNHTESVLWNTLVFDARAWIYSACHAWREDSFNAFVIANIKILVLILILCRSL